MKFKALVIYIKFNGEQNIWDNMIDKSNKYFRILPPEVLFLQEKLNSSFDYFVPLTFRYLYACREFDFVGVYKNEEDSQPILELINQYILDNNIETLKVKSCYGEVCYLDGETEIETIVHQMWGKAVLGAIKY